jgi:hypothetical protein
MGTTDSPSPQRWWLRIFLTLASVLLLYVLSSGPVDYYLGYQFGRGGGRVLSDLIVPRWRNSLYRPLSATAKYLHFDAIESYQQRCWARGYRAGDKDYIEMQSRRQNHLAPSVRRE